MKCHFCPFLLPSPSHTLLSSSSDAGPHSELPCSSSCPSSSTAHRHFHGMRSFVRPAPWRPWPTRSADLAMQIVGNFAPEGGGGAQGITSTCVRRGEARQGRWHMGPAVGQAEQRREPQCGSVGATTSEPWHRFARTAAWCLCVGPHLRAAAQQCRRRPMAAWTMAAYREHATTMTTPTPTGATV